MTVSTLHPQFKEKIYEIRQMRDTLLGPSSVKRAGALYLPIPTAMFVAAGTQPPAGVSYDSGNSDKGSQEASINAPWRHSIPAYQAFLQRARFPDITALIHRGLVGVATKTKPVISLPSSIDYLEEYSTRDGKSLDEVFKYMISEVLATGQVEILVDVDETRGKLVLVPYSSDSMINWKTCIEKDRKVVSLCVFEEPYKSSRDEFEHEDECKYKVCRSSVIVEGLEVSAYNIQEYIDDSPREEIIPTLRGKTYPEIPVVVARVSDSGLDAEWTCPLVGVSDIAISVYQKDADMSNSEYLTCNPMLVFSGVNSDDDEVPNIIGSSVTWTLPDYQAKAYYVEPTANCLGHMSKRIESMFDEAVQYGVSILGQSESSGEAAETVRMRQAGNSSNLRTIIESCAEALEDALEICEKWEKNSNENTGEIEFVPNLELTEMKLTPQEQNALLQSWLADGITHRTYLKNLEAAGVKLSEDTIDKEIGAISIQPPSPSSEDQDED